MTMAISAYKTKRHSRAQAATALAIGFVGQLKNWWDNFLNAETRVKILNHTYKRVDDKGKEVDEEDRLEMLIHTITLHFIGNPKE